MLSRTNPRRAGLATSVATVTLLMWACSSPPPVPSTIAGTGIGTTPGTGIGSADTAGIMTTIAGTGIQGLSGDGGPATAAKLDEPGGVAVDAAGNVYIADRLNHRVGKVDTAGIITTIAGTGIPGFSGDDGPATAAQLNTPFGVAVDAAGNVYIADSKNNRVRKVDPAGIITTIAGTGIPGFSGDDGPATAAQLNTPFGVAVDAAGNIYIADTSNHRVRKVDTAGIITTIAGTGDGAGGFSGDDHPASAAQLRAPRGVAVDAAGNVYIADLLNDRVRKVNTNGTITTSGGSGIGGFSGDGGPATAAQLFSPFGVAVDPAGGVIVADTFNHRVRRIGLAALR